jgi:predicted glycosyltransferase
MNYWEVIFKDLRIEEEKIVSMSPDELATHLIYTQLGLDELKEIIEELTDEIEQKEMLIREIHSLSDI